MPNGFYFTLGFFTALLWAALCQPDAEARKWIRRMAGVMLGCGLVAGLCAAAIAALL
ncbi:hypothetical protein [Nocardia sp. NPDC004860]|uniref:hypothetical protein n=1 Tax=Nocardia sp. NPDC004860 TaxID=3154557 RepID=UPI0033B4C18E